jgi:citrate lyase subunit beta/citryl-CoA lyase
LTKEGENNILATIFCGGEMEPLRTLLSVPGIRKNMIEKARSLPADVLVLDLEDSVPTAEKAKARAIVADSLDGMALKGQKVFVRINTLSSSYGQQDLEAVITTGIDGISQPKPSSGDEVRQVEAIIERLEGERGIKQGHIKLIPWIETAKGLLNAFDIASASPRVVGVSLGAEDLALDTGMERTEEGGELLIPRTMVVIAAKAAEVIAIDTPYNNFRDEEGLIKEASFARSLGFEGKFLVHPNQIEPVNQVFCPTPEEVTQARRIVEAFATAEAQGFATTSLDGKMIDTPQARKAQRLLAMAEFIAQREKGNSP